MLKLLALVTMVIDHLGAIFFPEQDWMRAIGRLTMPIFAYAIARGFFYTSNVNKYIFRMGLLAILSQLPFTLMFGMIHNFTIFGVEAWFPTLNMIVPWTLALILLKLPVSTIPLVLVPLYFVPMDYSALVILLPIVFYHFRFKLNSIWLTVVTSAIVLTVIALNSGDPKQWWSLIAIPVILLLEKYDSKVSLNRWLFYWFYPAHIFVLYLIALMVGIKVPLY